MSKVIVIGGGPAGMFAAIAAAENGHEVTILEKNEKLGKKLFITGKGRCNITNASDMDVLFANVMTNSKFLYSAFDTCSNEKVIDFFEQNGCPTKVERGNRVFPVSDHSSDVIAALQRALKEKNVKVLLHTEVAEILTESLTLCAENETSDTGCRDANQNGAEGSPASEGSQNVSMKTKKATDKWAAKKKKAVCDKKVTGVRLDNGKELHADSVILATGGFSYQATGSTGDGYRFAQKLGHTVTEIQPSLVPFYTKESYVTELQGLSLRNVNVRIRDGKKILYDEFGEMLFTHFGVTGPLMLSASAAVKPVLEQPAVTQQALAEKKQNGGNVRTFAGEAYRNRKLTLKKEFSVEIDLKPALSEEQLDQRLLREFEEAKNKQFKNSITHLFPAKLLPVMLQLSGIEPEKKVNEITKEERQGFVRLIKAFPMTLTGLRDFNEAIITRGGVKVKEVNPSTMESKLVKNLYICGELLDLDAMTGGFNLQIAWSTGFLAGSCVE